MEKPQIDRSDQHQNGSQRLEALACHGVGNEREHAERGDLHHHVGDFQDHIGRAVEEIPDELALPARHEDTDTQKQGEEDDGEHIPVGKRRDRVFRDDGQKPLGNRGRIVGGHRDRVRPAEIDTLAGPEGQPVNHPDNVREDRRDEVEHDRLAADRAEFLRVAQRHDAGDERGQDQGHDQHADQANEEIAHRLDVGFKKLRRGVRAGERRVEGVVLVLDITEQAERALVVHVRHRLGVVDERVDAARDDLVDVEELPDGVVEFVDRLADALVLLLDGVHRRGDGGELGLHTVDLVLELLDGALVVVAEVVGPLVPQAVVPLVVECFADVAAVTVEVFTVIVEVELVGVELLVDVLLFLLVGPLPPVHHSHLCTSVSTPSLQEPAAARSTAAVAAIAVETTGPTARSDSGGRAETIIETLFPRIAYQPSSQVISADNACTGRVGVFRRGTAERTTDDRFYSLGGKPTV